jgi:hypothetical protein
MTSAAQPVTRSRALGWRAGASPPAFDPRQIAAYLQQVREPLHIVSGPGPGLGVAPGGGIAAAAAGDFQLVGLLPPLYPEWLGDRAFCEAHGVRFPYVAGEMANGIATTRMVIALAQAEMLGFFGAAGLALESVERAVHELSGVLSGWPR